MNKSKIIHVSFLALSIAAFLPGCDGGGDDDPIINDEETVDDTGEETGGDTGEDTEGDPSEEAEGDTGEDTEGDTSEETEGDTGEDTEGDTSEEAEGHTDEETGDSTATGISISAKIWMTSDCNQGDEGYIKTLFEFTADGSILAGHQGFHDSSCTSTSDTIYPYNEARTYTQGAIQTLQDGTSGYPITVAGFDDGGTADGYYTITAQNELCFSTNFTVNTNVLSSDGTNTSEINYNNCLTAHGEAAGGSTPTDPTTNSGEEVVEFLHTEWLADNICYPDDNGEGSYQRFFQFMFNGLVLNSSFLDYSTPDCTGESRPDHIAWTEDQGEFVDLGEETLADGAVGHRIQMTNPATNLSETVGYYVINDMDQLCLSYNLGLNSDTNGSSTDIDYEHCLKPYDWEE
jgi:hypothetical protein